MLSTLLDASASSRTRFVREIVALVLSGLRARATQTAEPGARRLVADGFCLAGVWLLTLFLSSDVGNRIRGRLPGYPWHLFTPWSLGLLCAALALALIGRDRLAGATALLFTASIIHDPAHYDLTNGGRVSFLVPVICFGVLLLAPRRRKPDARRLAWLVVTAALALISSTADDTTAAVLILALIFLVPPALALLPINPRFLAIACALPATYFGTRIAQDPGGPGKLGLLFLAAAPLVLTIAITRIRHLQARSPI